MQDSASEMSQVCGVIRGGASHLEESNFNKSTSLFLRQLLRNKEPTPPPTWDIGVDDAR